MVVSTLSTIHLQMDRWILISILVWHHAVTHYMATGTPLPLPLERTHDLRGDVGTINTNTAPLGGPMGRQAVKSDHPNRDADSQKKIWDKSDVNSYGLTLETVDESIDYIIEDSVELSDGYEGNMRISTEEGSQEVVDADKDLEPNGSSSEEESSNTGESGMIDSSHESSGTSGFSVILITIGSFILLVFIIIVFVFLGRKAENALADRENVKHLERYDKCKENESSHGPPQYGPPPTYDEAIQVYCISQTAETQL